MEASPLTADPAIRSARIISLAWGAHFLVFGGRYVIADPLIATIGALAGEPDAALDPQALGLLHQVRAVRASAAGDLGRCLTGLESALQAFEQAGDLRNACAVRNNLGYMYSELGDFQRAEAALRQALRRLRPHGAPRSVGAPCSTTSAASSASGPSWPRPSASNGWPSRRFGRQGEPRMEGLARIYLAEILIARGDSRAPQPKKRRPPSPRWWWRPPSGWRRWARWPEPGWAAAIVTGGLAAAGEAHAALERLGEIEEGESMVRLTYAEALAAAGQEAEARAALAAGPRAPAGARRPRRRPRLAASLPARGPGQRPHPRPRRRATSALHRLQRRRVARMKTFESSARAIMLRDDHPWPPSTFR